MSASLDPCFQRCDVFACGVQVRGRMIAPDATSGLIPVYLESGLDIVVQNHRDAPYTVTVYAGPEAIDTRPIRAYQTLTIPVAQLKFPVPLTIQFLEPSGAYHRQCLRVRPIQPTHQPGETIEVRTFRLVVE